MSYPYLRCYSWWGLRGSWNKWLYRRGSKENIGFKGGSPKIFFKFCGDGISNNANKLPDCQKPVFVLSLFLSFRRLEVVGEIEKRRARRRHAPSPLSCLILARRFLRTTSKRLLPRLWHSDLFIFYYSAYRIRRDPAKCSKLARYVKVVPFVNWRYIYEGKKGQKIV